MSTSARASATMSTWWRDPAVTAASTNPGLELGPRVGARVAVLDDDRRRKRESPIRTLACRYRAGAGHDDGAFRHHEWTVGRGLDDLALDEIVDWRRSRQDG